LGGLDGIKAGDIAVEIDEAIRRCPNHKRPIIVTAPLPQALTVKFSVTQKHDSAPRGTNSGDHFEQISVYFLREMSFFSLFNNPRYRNSKVPAQDRKHPCSVSRACLAAVYDEYNLAFGRQTL
jgi:hypothetical protein